MKRQPPDLYAVLGLTSQATQAQLRHAYRALLRQHHPDLCNGGQDQPGSSTAAALQDVLTAYHVLRDPDRRAAYDQLRTSTAPPQSRPTVQVHWRGPQAFATPPIQAGPVRWHQQGPKAGTSDR